MHRDADEQVIRLVMVLEMRNLVGGIDAIDEMTLRVLDAPRRHRSHYNLEACDDTGIGADCGVTTCN